jgi:hypothetical protein
MTEPVVDGRRSVTLRRYLARQLKAQRLVAKKTVGDAVTARIGSRTKIERIESARVGVKLATVIHMCQVYKVDEATTAKLRQTVEDIPTAGEVWWEAYGDLLSESFTTFLELESIADRIFLFDPDVVPGLLQARAYQRAQFESSLDFSEEYAQRQTEMRSKRQEAAFGRSTPLEVVAVIGEGALKQLVGGQDSLTAQRVHLLAQSRKGNVEIQVLPYSAGAHPAMKGAFNILEFDALEEPNIIYVESYLGGSYASHSKIVGDFHKRFNRIHALSVPIEEYPA